VLHPDGSIALKTNTNVPSQIDRLYPRGRRSNEKLKEETLKKQLVELNEKNLLLRQDEKSLKSLLNQCEGVVSTIPTQMPPPSRVDRSVTPLRLPQPGPTLAFLSHPSTTESANAGPLATFLRTHHAINTCTGATHLTPWIASVLPHAALPREQQLGLMGVLRNEAQAAMLQRAQLQDASMLFSGHPPARRVEPALGGLHQHDMNSVVDPYELRALLSHGGSNM
jgi:hypothetical protein